MKATIRVTKQFNLEMAHALFRYDGPCRNIHGHSYSLFITVMGIPVNEPLRSDDGMVMDFTILKKVVDENIIREFDHALLLNTKSFTEAMKEQAGFQHIIEMNYQPTCENILLEFKNIIANKLPDNVKLCYMKLQETPTCYAEWLYEDNL